MSKRDAVVQRVGLAERLTRDGFERLTAAQAERLITRRFQLFSAQGFAWNEALRLAVQPD